MPLGKKHFSLNLGHVLRFLHPTHKYEDKLFLHAYSERKLTFIQHSYHTTVPRTAKIFRERRTLVEDKNVLKARKRVQEENDEFKRENMPQHQ